MEKQLELFKKLEIVLHRNESSCFDAREDKEEVTSPAHMESVTEIERMSEVVHYEVDEIGELTLPLKTASTAEKFPTNES